MWNESKGKSYESGLDLSKMVRAHGRQNGLPIGALTQPLSMAMHGSSGMDALLAQLTLFSCYVSTPMRLCALELQKSTASTRVPNVVHQAGHGIIPVARAFAAECGCIGGCIAVA